MPDAPPRIATVAFGSPAYHSMTALRDAVLRRPLGLALTAADTAGEESQVHIAALDGETVVGTVLLKPLGPTMKMRQVVVAPDRQGTGLGAALVRFAEGVARDRGATRIALHARAEVAAFYERLGYVVEGEPFREIGLPHVGMAKPLRGSGPMFVPVTDSDVPAVVALMNRAYRGSGSARAWSTEVGYLSGDRTTEPLLRADIAAKPAASLLKWEDATGTLQGCVWLEPLQGEAWYLGSLTVDPAQQNGGFGRTLLAAAEGWIRERGGRQVRLTVVNVRDTLIAWYVRRGYRLTGETQPFPYDDDRFGIPLRDDLSFVVLDKDLP